MKEKMLEPHVGIGCAGAAFSPSRKYRYALWRVWDREKPAIIFIGLNPSYANEYKDDPTVVRMSRYARYNNYGGVYIGNLFAMVATHPKTSLFDSNAIGAGNDKFLLELTHVAGIIIVGWGNHGAAINRNKTVLDVLGKPVYCFSVTKLGMPTHPLYLPYATELREYLPDPEKTEKTKFKMQCPNCGHTYTVISEPYEREHCPLCGHEAPFNKFVKEEKSLSK